MSEPFRSTIGLDGEAADKLSKPFAVLYTGKFKRGDFPSGINVTTADLDKAVSNFEAINEANGGQGIVVDYEHSFAKGGDSRAAGWIKKLYRDGKSLMAQVDWTPQAATEIGERIYKLFSPEFSTNWKDESGRARGFTLLAGALTNRPHLRGLTGVALDESAAPKGEKMARNPFNVVADHYELTEGIAWHDAHQRVFDEAGALAAERGIELREAATILADALPAENVTEAPTVDGGTLQIQDVGYGDGTQPIPDDNLEALDKFAAENGVGRFVAADLQRIDAEIRELEAPPRAHAAAWLDARPLKESPRPWSTDDWERDQRRATVAGVPLDKDTWASFAENGQDAVAELAEAYKSTSADDLRRYRANLLAVEQPKEEQRRVKALQAAKDEAAEKRRQRELELRHGPQANWLQYVPLEDVARAAQAREAFSQPAPRKGGRK